MNDEKKYNEALERARKLYEQGTITESLCYVFPELKESEDERIRKDLIDYFHGDSLKHGIGQVINWLEKQGEQKPVEKDESKFKVGDKIKYSSKVYDVLAVKEHYYELSDGNFCEFKNQDSYELVEQKPADKKGMNLVEEEMTPFQKKVFDIIDTAIEEEQGLKQVCDELLALASNEIEQDPTWSEEDDRMLDKCIKAACSNYYPGISSVRDWLRGIKDRVLQQPKQEWSEEDERNLNDAILFVETGTCSLNKDNLINWLKLLRPQNNVTDEELAQAKKDAYNDALDKIEYHSGEPTFDDGWSAAIWYLKKRNVQPQTTWKPSDEQIIALRWVLNNIPYNKHKEEISGLLDQIKEL